MRVRHAPLWLAFLAAHLLVAWWGWALPHQPMGDVSLVYEPWAREALTGGPVVGIDAPWVYPQLALVPMMLAAGIAWVIAPLAGSSAYLIAWAVLVTLLDAAAFAVLLRRLRKREGRTAAWFWIIAMLALGPIAMYRIDAITVPLALMAGLWIAKRPAVAGILLAVGAWIKIWPGALLAASVVASRARLKLLVAGAATTVGVILVLLLLGAGSRLFGFLGAQTGRGLQIEAVAATPFLWLAPSGQTHIVYSYEILTYQVIAPLASAVATATLPLLVFAVGALLILGLSAQRRGASYRMLFPPLALGLVTALIVFNKVGSPQFIVWLFVPAMLWILHDRVRAGVPAILVLALCGLTFLIYPVLYGRLLSAELLPIVLLSVRNALLIVLLVLCVRRLVHLVQRPTLRH